MVLINSSRKGPDPISACPHQSPWGSRGSGGSEHHSPLTGLSSSGLFDLAQDVFSVEEGHAVADVVHHDKAISPLYRLFQDASALTGLQGKARAREVVATQGAAKR